jgi:hypothetical protein
MPLGKGLLNLWPLGELVHSSQEVLIPPIALREGSCNVYGNPLECCPNVISCYSRPSVSKEHLKGYFSVHLSVCLHDSTQEPLIKFGVDFIPFKCTLKWYSPTG